MTLPVAVIGLGTMGGRYAETLAAGRFTGAALHSVCDIDPNRVGPLAEQFGVAGFPSVAALLDGPRPGAAYIATPDGLHRDAAAALARAGVALLVEKPLATTVADAMAIRDAAAAGAAPAEVNFSNRWNPPFAAAKAAIDAGRIGDVLLTTARLNNVIASPRDRLKWSGQTTPAWFLMSHCLDLAHWLHGKRAQTVSAMGGRKLLPSIGVNTWDYVLASVRYEDGVHGTFESAWILPESHPAPIEFEFRVIGTNGALTVDTTHQMIRIEAEALSFPQVLAWAGDRFRSFVDHVEGRPGAVVPLDAGVENTKTLVAIHRALESAAIEKV